MFSAEEECTKNVLSCIFCYILQPAFVTHHVNENGQAREHMYLPKFMTVLIIIFEVVVLFVLYSTILYKIGMILLKGD